MSTAIVSPFIDMSDVLHQNQRNFANNRSQNQNFDQKVVGSPIRAPINRSRVSQMASMKLPNQPAANRLISLQEAMLQTQQSHQQQHLQSLPKLTRSVSEPITEKVVTVQGPQSTPPQQQKNHIDSSRYKTELCRPFEENGFCKYGDKCQFAHGMPELRSLARHPKYKTELCRTFHTTGFCKYGPRCHFIHNEDAGKLNQINQLKQQQVVQQLSNSLSVPVSQTQQQVPPSPVRSVSQPMPVTRPKFNLPLPPMMRESLGSCADSPPSSVTSDSPTMSPTLLREQDMYTGFPGAFSPPPVSAPATAPVSAFNFQDFSSTAMHQQGSTMAPLNVQTDPIASLAAGLQAASLNQRNNNTNTAVINADLLRDLQELLAGYSTHSPDSISSSNSNTDSGFSTCGSPLEVSRSLRLPIFSSLVNDE